MLLLLGFAFLAGFVTILAPCIWPLLPIILSSSLSAKEQSHHRALGITLGIMVSFTIITLSISTLVKLFHFDPNVLRIFAVIIIGFLGLTMVIPALSKVFEIAVTRLTNLLGMNTVQNQQKGFLPGFITGLSLGIVWSPCAGPILATIATLAATGQVTVTVLLITLAYVIGIGIPLFLFAYGSQKFITKSRRLSPYTEVIQQVFGVIMILSALAIYTNYDQVLQNKLLDAFPVLNQAVNGFESNDTVTNQLNILKGTTPTKTNNTSDLFNTNTPAPDFVGITTWLNTNKPLSLKQLKGKVILVDFWTYTCINCIRTLPHITQWYDKYKDKGFVVVGIHTPEFAFEHNTDNVKKAITMYTIHYPVGQDNDYATWNNYNNQYWPAEYLIDARGIIRREHFGEGEYDQMDQAIQTLLQEAGQKITTTHDTMPDQTPHAMLSPETYLGSNRMQYYYPDGSLPNGQQAFMLDTTLPQDRYSLGGTWTITNEAAIAGKNAKLFYHFTASKVYIILRPGNTTNGTVTILLDGKKLTAQNQGKDIRNSMITVTTDRLYNIIDLGNETGEHTVELQFQTPGIEAYTFTFG